MRPNYLEEAEEVRYLSPKSAWHLLEKGSR